MNVASVLKVGGQTHPKYLDNKKKLHQLSRKGLPALPPPR